ncbi:MAG: hypothetical protein WC648_02245 [Candidatus Paceibacterota bacterium]|jgi:hypothetical protein
MKKELQIYLGSISKISFSVVIISLFFFRISSAAVATPTNENVLCVYNSLSDISTAICDYYLEKRPGAHLLGLDIDDSKFHPKVDFVGVDGPRFKDDTHLREVITFESFRDNLALPIQREVSAHPEWNITHLAIAKDLPTTIDFVTRRVSAAYMLGLSFPENTTYEDIEAFKKKIPYDYNRNQYNVTGKEEMKYAACAMFPVHFRPQTCVAWQGIKFRFAVSYLTGFTVADVKKMIDKARMPTVAISEAKWLMDAKQGWGLKLLEDAYKIMLDAGMSSESIITEKTATYPVTINATIVGYGGQGVHHGYTKDWAAKVPAINVEVSNRAILSVYESWFAVSANKLRRPTLDQGSIYDAISPEAFGGENYSKSFSGGMGTVFEPYIGGVVTWYDLFTNYWMGKTLGETWLASTYMNRHIAMSVGDPIMRLYDTPSLNVNRAPVVNAGEDMDVVVNSFPAKIRFTSMVGDDNYPEASLTYKWINMNEYTPIVKFLDSFLRGNIFGFLNSSDILAAGLLAQNKLIESDNTSGNKKPPVENARVPIFNFDCSTCIQTTATFPEPGKYTIRFEVSDGEKTGYDEVTVNLKESANASQWTKGDGESSKTKNKSTNKVIDNHDAIINNRNGEVVPAGTDFSSVKNDIDNAKTQIKDMLPQIPIPDMESDTPNNVKETINKGGENVKIISERIIRGAKKISNNLFQTLIDIF